MSQSVNILLVNILLVFECIGFLVSLFYFNYLKREELLYIFILLLVIVFSEAVGKLIDIRLIRFIKSNQWFNIMVPVQFLCLLLLFHKKTTYRYWRVIILVFISLSIMLTLAFFLSAPNKSFNTLNYTIQSVFVSACCLHYLFECMNNKQIVHITKNVMMYLALGTLLFYLGTLPFHSMRNYLYRNYKNIFYTYYYIFFILNYIMYGLTTFGIVWAQKK
jgi:hypothetical protein